MSFNNSALSDVLLKMFDTSSAEEEDAMLVVTVHELLKREP